jgi:hypothetical protein
LDTIKNRTKIIRRALARGLGHRPSVLQEVALTRCALLQAQAEAILLDPKAGVHARLRMTAAARQALRDLPTLLKEGRKPKRRGLTLGEAMRAAPPL